MSAPQPLEFKSDTHLPQCGFGADIDFDSLIKANRFLFRIYTPKEGSVADNSDAYFIAPRFNEQVARSPIDLPNIKFPETLVGTYAEVARHMEWTTKASSCYISSSFSFAWAIWEAVKRYHVGVKKDVQIAVIDASALGGRAATALQLLLKSTENQRDDTFRKWRRFAEDSQTVLIYGMVPRQAVLASIPLLHILRKLPSYFLCKDVQLIHGNPLDQVAWNYTSRKLGYHQFCREVSTLFLNRPEDVKLRDSTAGAVRLALAFLRPFFHNVVQDDFDIAISYLRNLAISISEWPADGWVRNYAEVRQIVDSMALALGEELREKYAVHHRSEITRLQLVIDGLEQSMKAQKNQVPTVGVDDVEVDSDGDFEVEFGDTDETLVALDPEPTKQKLSDRRSSLKMSIAVLPRIPVSFQTPITPPESPRNSLLFPTVTIPLSDVGSTKFSFKPMNEESEKASETPISPPVTPPPRSPVFSHHDSTLAVLPLQDQKSVHDNGDDQESKMLQKEVEETLEREVLAQKHRSNVEEIVEDDDDEKTEPGDDIPSTWSSPCSSVFSIETLCDNTDVSYKRLSFGHSRSNSFDIFGPPVSGRASRTVSFSKPVLPFLLEPPTNPLKISLPPSPTLSRPDSPAGSRSESMPPSPSVKPSSSPHARYDRPDDLHPSIILPKRSVGLLSPRLSHDDDEETEALGFRPVGITENASYIVTGFLVGAFLTLFLFSTQRRTLLYVT